MIDEGPLELLIVACLVWLVLLTLTNPMLWFGWIKFRAWLRMPRMRRELKAMGKDPNARFKPRIVVKRMKDGKEVF